MQSEITDRAAIVFAHEFYQAVANGHPVDAALTAARQIINAEVNDVEWSAPVLYMRAPDGRIFDIQGAADTAPPPPPPPAPDTAALRKAALTAMAREGWDEAIATWGRLLEFEPGDAEARARLDESRRQRELAALYASARQHLDAGRWHAALNDLRHLRADGGAYRDVVALIAAAEGQIARIQELDRLYRRGQERANAGRWPEALSDFGRVRAMDGDYKEVNALIAIAERELAKARDLEGYYSRGLAHFGAGRWQPALDDFTRVQALGGDYKGVRAYAATAERELAGLAASAGRRVPLLTRFKLLSTGGVIALGALLTLCCGVAFLAVAANQSATPTRPPAALEQRGMVEGIAFTPAVAAPAAMATVTPTPSRTPTPPTTTPTPSRTPTPAPVTPTVSRTPTPPTSRPTPPPTPSGPPPRSIRADTHTFKLKVVSDTCGGFAPGEETEETFVFAEQGRGDGFITAGETFTITVPSSGRSRAATMTWPTLQFDYLTVTRNAQAHAIITWDVENNRAGIVERFDTSRGPCSISYGSR